MNQKNLVVALLGIVFAVGCQPSDITACDPQGCLSEASFSQNIVNRLNGNVTGYVVYVGGLAPVFAGQARTATDPPSLAVLPLQNINVASVSKTLTAVGVLQSLANHGLSIDSNISPYIYSDWTQGRNINTITFRDLMNHRSGFPGPVCDGRNTEYAVLKTIIQNGVSATHETDPAVYSNCDFAIFRELLSIMEEGNSIAKIPDGPLRAITSAGLYVGYMNHHVFSPLALPTLDCAPTTDPYSAMLAYPFPPGTTPGWDGGGNWTLSCGGGGWNMSAGNLFWVLNDVANGNILLTQSQKAQMVHTSSNPSSNNFLGWDNAVRNDCPSPYAVCKNGSINSGSNYIRTYLGVFKCNVPVVVLVNSPLPPHYQSGDGDIIGLVADSYKALPQSPPPQPCPPGSLLSD